MNRKFIVPLLLILGLSLSVSAQAKEILIKFSHVVSADTPKGKGAELFKKLVSERLKGKVKVEVFPNSQLYNDKAVLKALALGDVQMAAPSLSKFGKYTKKYGVFDLPFLFKDTKSLACFTGGDTGSKLLTAIEDKGFTGLAYWLNGMKQLSANKPLKTPADAKGLKFRIMSSDVLAAQFEAVDANPQKMSFSEVYNGLQTGVIDGQENTWSNIYTKKFFEVQHTISESNHGVLEYLVVTNTKFWKGLPADIRTELEKILKEVTLKVTAWALEKADADKAKITKAGKAAVISLSEAQLDKWRQAMAPVWTKFEGEIGKDSIAAAVACNK
ncbi:MAG: C4-dicarboxylate ABC transporter [Gammaproteobacteria bacterium]|nr:MAG: C4-dicarboxylate ABC transporter [Gammaproteobacteria bacterium]